MGYISVTVMVLVIVNICVLVVIQNRKRHNIAKNDILKLRLKEEQNMYHKINELYEESRIMRHDLKHYLAIILGMIINEEYKDAEDYIIDFIGRRVNTPIVYYQGSSAINAVLNDKYSVCKNKSIDIQLIVSGNVPKEHELDIAIILANLLDNAIEAQRPLENKKIWVSMVAHKGMYYIIVRNRVSCSVLNSNFRLHTTKQDKKRHGLGINSVIYLVHNMDGYYQRYEEQDTFTTYISIPF